ncbi:MAG TPA: GNAT family N-acetyltransferase [Thermoplasmata archaeon]|nr:GNAT family N-acetyltransferase [Thermoplasmata archaeon]HEV2429837.1 GNAT family N-acetyltransferase [Thermoplasmata archaeon]
MTWTGKPPETTLAPISGADLDEFRGTLEDTPANSEALAALASGHSRTFLLGDPQAPGAALIDNCWDQDEPTAIGTDAESIWTLLSQYSGWTCVGGLQRPTAEALAEIFRRELGLEPSFKAAVLFVLKRPAIPHESKLVRLLDVHDTEMVDRAPPEMLGLYRGGAELLARAKVAAGVSDGGIVGWMTSGEWSLRHAGVGGHVLEPWRNRGIGSSAAFLVAQAAQREGRAPTWSTGEDNPRSQHVARKLGFEECGRDWYVVLPALWKSGGYHPRAA